LREGRAAAQTVRLTSMAIAAALDGEASGKVEEACKRMEDGDNE
jgi:hypothetical protein